MHGAINSEVTPPTGVEGVAGVEWLAENADGNPANPGKAVATAWGGGNGARCTHELVADVAVRDAFTHGRLQLHLYERRKLPGEESSADGEEPTHADQPGKLIGVGMGAVDATEEGEIALPPLEGVRLAPMATAAATTVPALGEAQATLRTTVNFIKPKEQTRVSFFAPVAAAAPVPLASIQLTLVLNQEPDAPPPAAVEEQAGGKGGKKK